MEKLTQVMLTTEECLRNFSDETKLIYTEYLSYLLFKEVLSEVSTEAWVGVRQLELSWDYPGAIMDAVIECKGSSRLQLKELLDDLCTLGCRHALFLIDEDVLIGAQEVMSAISESALRSCDIFLKCKEETWKEVVDLLHGDARVLTVRRLQLEPNTEDLDWAQLFDGSPKLASMVNELRFYCEARLFNPAFNRRIWVTASGLCYSGRPTVGNGFPVTAISRNDEGILVFAQPEWTMLSSINKDQIEVCKDCEFRHCCYDTRIPVRCTSSGWRYTSECNYNPYICKWKGEEGYRTLAVCGVSSNAEGFSIDHERIAAINAELWGE